MDAPSLFARLNRLNRLPTPPRENNDDKETCDTALAMLSSNLLFQPLSTPHESPVSVTGVIAGSTDKSGKRVKFDSTPCNIEEIENLSSTPASEKGLAGNKPIRSILKRSGSLLSSDPLSSDPLAPAEERDFPIMLEDMIRGLASPEISPRFDAYLSMNGCLKTYRDLPSQQALVEKITVLTEYIRRDLSEVKASDSPRSSQLIAEALRFTNTLLFSDPTKKALPQSFQSFILNHTINAVTNQDTSKNLTQQYLFLLGIQEFGPKVMNKERANRLLAALLKIDSRFKSKSITAQKLGVHKQVLRQEQAKLVMIARASDWMGHLFKCLLSEIKEIRIRAIEFGLSAGHEIGAELLVSKAFRHLFDITSTNGDVEKTYAQSVMDTLKGWIDLKEHCMHIPQIWSIAVLFCRNKERSFDTWKQAPAWLKLIQKCFNSSDVKLKSQANQAWTRLIYAVLPDEKTSYKTSALLLAPLESQMGRFKTFDPETKEVRRVTYAAYCTLLYYSLRPGREHDTLNRYWMAFVEPIMKKKSPKPFIESDTLCRILSSLLGGNPSYAYDIERIKRAAMLKPEEVPALDVRWIRSRADTITSILKNLITDEHWWNTDKGDVFLRLWNLFTKAIGQASAKEVKTSNETMGALGNVMRCLQQYLDKARATKGNEEAFKRFAILLQTAVDNIGCQPFTERRLERSVFPDAFDAINTSPGYFSKPNDVISPILYLLDNLVSYEVQSPEESYVGALRLLLDTAIASNTSFLLKVRKIREVASCLDWATAHHSSSKAIFWDVVADRFENVLAESRVGTPESESRSFGVALGEAVFVLKSGADHVHYNESRSWFSALDALEYEFQSTMGIAGSSIYFVEPLAEYFHEKLISSSNDDAVEFSCTIISKSRWHSSPKDVERAWRSMYGVAPNFVKKSSSDIFEHLYSLVSRLLSTTYSDSLSTRSVTAVLSVTRRLLDRCPKRFFKNALKRVQSGLNAWIKDEKQVLNNDNTASQSVFKLVVELWRTILGKICTLEYFDTTLLQNLALSLSAGFSSRHKAIVNQSITMWNATFGLANRLEYPEDLRTILFRLSLITDLQLPGLCVQGEASQIDSTPLEFADTPENVGQLLAMSEPSAGGSDPQILPEDASILIARTELDVRATTPEPSPVMKRKQAPDHIAPRLRHDNSQIEFATIDSSPSNLEAMESQLLTDRQKEVKERQSREAAAMFPDVRSSPRTSTLIRRDSTPRLQLSQRDIVEASGGAKEAISPTLLPADKMTPFLGSSPTPSQRSSSSRGKSKANPIAQPSELPEIQMEDLAQDITFSPPSVVERDVPILPTVQVDGLSEQDEDEEMQGLDRVEAKELPEHTHGPAIVAMVDTNLGPLGEKQSPSEVNNIGLHQTSTDDFVDAEMGETYGQPVTQIIRSNSPSTRAEDVQMGEQPLDASMTEESDEHNIDPAEASGYSSDHSDLVNSQIARELESASQDTIVYPSPRAVDSMSSSIMQTSRKKRGRPTKRKREDNSTASKPQEEIYDSITVARPSSPSFETAQEGSQGDGNGRPKIRTETSAETDQRIAREADTGISRPRKKSRRSSEGPSRSRSSQADRGRRRRGSSRTSSNPTSDAYPYSSPSSREPAVRSFLAVEVNSRRASPLPTRHEGVCGSAIDPSFHTSEKQEEEEVTDQPNNVDHASGSMPVNDVLLQLNEAAQGGCLLTDLEALLDKAKRGGIPGCESAGVMRFSMELMQMAMNAMEGQKESGGT